MMRCLVSHSQTCADSLTRVFRNFGCCGNFTENRISDEENKESALRLPLCILLFHIEEVPSAARGLVELQREKIPHPATKKACVQVCRRRFDCLFEYAHKRTETHTRQYATYTAHFIQVRQHNKVNTFHTAYTTSPRIDLKTDSVGDCGACTCGACTNGTFLVAAINSRRPYPTLSTLVAAARRSTRGSRPSGVTLNLRVDEQVRHICNTQKIHVRIFSQLRWHPGLFCL